MDDRFRDLLTHLTTRPGAGAEALRALQRRVRVALPVDYLAFLKFSDGAEGLIGQNIIVIRSTDQVSAGIGRPEDLVPELIVFADDGASGLFAFDTRTSPMPVVITHSDELDLHSLVPVAGSFAGFLEFLLENDWIDHWYHYRQEERLARAGEIDPAFEIED